LKTLTNILESYSQSKNSKGITFIKPKEHFLSYKKLSLNALKLLTHFKSISLTKNSKLIFQLNDNENFVHSFWASISGGIVSVPVSTGNNDEHRLKLFNIFNLLENAYLIVDNDILEKLEIFAKKNNLEDKYLKLKAKTIDIREIDLESLTPAKPIESKKDDLALIQFSSGSTGKPKGVVLTHENLIVNVKAIAKAKLVDIDRKLDELQSMKRTLSNLVDKCRGTDRPDCPILDDISGAKHTD
jgi:long-subunit acyl-CoA synthetase (AMP-forming)